jgi:beta-lactamase class A
VTTEQRLRAVLAAAGVDGAAHMVDIDNPTAEIGIDADRPVVLSSVFKVPLVLTLLRAADRGELELGERLTIGTRRTRGSPGLAALRDRVTMSLHDLACLSITISDVAAADALYDRLGGDGPINATLRELGLGHSTIRGCCRDLFGSLAKDAGGPPAQLPERLADPEVLARLSARDPVCASASLPRELTRLLSLLWRDEAARPESCAILRTFLADQALRPRIAAGFSDGGWLTATKSGTLPGIRNDIGVVEARSGRRFAIAVCLREDPARSVAPEADTLLGRVARMAVDDLLAR